MQCHICGAGAPNMFFHASSEADLDSVVPFAVVNFAACRQCLEKSGLDPHTASGLFEIFSRHKAAGSDERKVGIAQQEVRLECEAKCRHCGMSIIDVINTKTVSCDRCYESYGAFLREYLHAQRDSEKENAENELLKQMNEAVEQEDYERAAQLRDMIGGDKV